MSFVGVLPGGAGQADDGVAVDADEAPGLTDAVAFGQVLQDGDGGFLGEVAAIQRRTFAFREAGAAGVAVELSELLVLADSAADREVIGAALAVERAVTILAAEAGEVVHGVSWPAGLGRDAIREWERKTSYILRRIPHRGSTDLGHHREFPSLRICCERY
ncbi:MAG: hypothetical protein JO329_00160 [Planctomycetaceae bacterium]|nr:hypothetical protein [Planctomycetaceae bacterium]